MVVDATADVVVDATTVVVVDEDAGQSIGL